MSESENEIKYHSTRLSPDIYRRRRMLAGLGVVAILLAVVLTIQALSSDTRQVSGSQVSEQVENTHNQSATDVVVPLSIVAASTTTTLVIDGPPRVSIYGDSLADGFGGILKSTLDRQGVTTFLATKGSSGLSQPRFFDWPNHLNVWVPQENADVVVIGLGANDGQDVFVNDVSYSTNDPEWAVEYQRRVAEVITLVTSQGRSLVWVGTPDGKAKGFRNNLSILRTATKNAVEATRTTGADVTYIDTWSLFLGLDGNYSQYVIDPSDGERKKSRDGDGFHLSLVGNKMLAAAITAEVDAAFERRAAR
jgi:hypothetical protein